MNKNKLKKILQSFMAFGIVTSLGLSLDLSEVNALDVGGNSGGSRTREVIGTTYHPITNAPMEIQFIPGGEYKSSETDYYKVYGGKKLYLTSLGNGDVKFSAYTFRNPEASNKTPYDLGYLIDNQGIHSGSCNGNPCSTFPTKYKSTLGNRWYNVKTGSVTPNMQTEAKYEGNSVLYYSGRYGSLTGEKVEWRVLGYSGGGYPLQNPFFPADYPDSRFYSEAGSKKWLNRTSPIIPVNKQFKTEYDTGDPIKKEKWMKDHFLKSNPQFKNYSAKQLANIFSISSDPTKTAAIFTAWHQKSNGGIYYASFTCDPPKYPNTRLTRLRIYETSENESEKTFTPMTKTCESDENCLGEITRSSGKSDNKVIKEYVKDGAKLVSGKVYTVYSDIKNMDTPDTPSNSSEGKQAIYTSVVKTGTGKALDTSGVIKGKIPARLAYITGTSATNENALMRDWTAIETDYIMKQHNERILRGDKIYTKYAFKAPRAALKKVTVGAEVPTEFWLAGFNMYLEDDALGLTFDLTDAIDDMKMKGLAVKDPSGKIMKEGETLKTGVTYTISSIVEKSDGTKVVTPVKVLNEVFANGSKTAIVKGNEETTKKLELNKTVTINGKQTFTPTNKQSEIEVCSSIARYHDTTKVKENKWVVADDKICYKFSSKEDMAVKEVEVIKDGKVVEEVIPGESYGVRVVVTKPDGTKTVNNPTVKVEASDLATRNIITTASTTTPLKPKKEVTITKNNVIQVNSPSIKVCAIIADKHTTNKENVKNSNDGPVCKTITSEMNYSVKDLKVTPGMVYLDVNSSTVYQQLSFSFTARNSNETKTGKAVNIAIVNNATGKKVHEERRVLPPNQNVIITKAITMNLSQGKHNFYAQINNDVPREQKEYSATMSNPYIDNVTGIKTVQVQKNQKPVECKVVRKKNNWSITYSKFNWRGYLQPATCTSYDSKGNATGTYDCSYCVTTSTWTESETVSHYETLKIKTLFKSKATNNEWVELTSGGTGKVKAGYGFELKIEAIYDTNMMSASPKSWTSGCNGMSVSPQPTGTSLQNIISVTMPYTDKAGQKMTYVLSPVSNSGGVYNNTQTFLMPLREFNGEMTRKIFVNKNAADSNNSIEIQSSPIVGSYDKPDLNKTLCDKYSINLKIQGAHTDDIITNIIQ